MAIFDMTVFLSGDILDADLVADTWYQKILKEYLNAATETFEGSQRDVPVGETGDLKDLAELGDVVESSSGFEIEITYGSEKPTDKDYSYSEGAATTNYPAGDMEADSYAWMVELGHLSRAGNPVAAQPYLGPNFDSGVDDLLDALEGLLDK